ncbi:MAG TPA: hypothetical protein VF789_28210 [Thermoanaerobaculia bacterium]
MSYGNQDHYTVKIVFRGLFLAVIHEPDGNQDGFIEVLLPEASSPAHLIAQSKEPLRSLLSNLQPLREHHGVVEFPVADWENRSEFTPGLIQVAKPTKEPVGMFFLKGHRIRFRGLWAREGVPPANLVEEKYLYSELNSQLLLLRRHTDHGFDQLPGIGTDPTADLETRENASAAITTFRFGEIYTERRSQLRENGREVERKWEQITAAAVKMEAAHDPERARPINLDLVVRFDLPMTNPLLVVCEPFEESQEEHQFILRPSQAERGVTVWIKNRELEATLNDSDLLSDPFGIPCPDFDGVDRDHAFYMRLAADPTAVLLPRDVNDDAADCGSGCGGCGHSSGGSGGSGG